MNAVATFTNSTALLQDMGNASIDDPMNVNQFREDTSAVVARMAVVLLTAFMVMAAFVATSEGADAAVSSGKAVCYDNMVDVQPPVAGQQWTYLRFYLWDGAKWTPYFEERFTGPIVAGSVVYNDANRVFMAPKDKYIAVRAWGYYPEKGWVSYPIGHGYQLSSTFTGAYCRA